MEEYHPPISSNQQEDEEHLVSPRVKCRYKVPRNSSQHIQGVLHMGTALTVTVKRRSVRMQKSITDTLLNCTAYCQIVGLLYVLMVSEKHDSKYCRQYR